MTRRITSESRPRLLLLAPHSDDIAYSLGATLLSPGWKTHYDLDIVTVFTRSSHAPYLSTTSASEITCVRTEEDRIYADTIGARWIGGPFGETTTRGYPDTRSIYLVRDPRDDQIFAEVRDFLTPMMSTGNGYRMVVAPLGIGGHIEHQIVFRIVCDHAEIPALFYEDQPYAADFSDYYLNRIVDSLLGAHRNGLVCASERFLSEKISRLSIYRSQFGPGDEEPLLTYCENRRPGDKVRWLTDPPNMRAAEVLWGSEDTIDLVSGDLARFVSDQHPRARDQT
ncbi:MAG: hypothetical protein RLN78_07890 [Phycisphaerales bacterium]